MSSSAMHARYRRCDGVMSRRFDGEVVILQLAKGEYFGLDDVGAEVWDALVEGATPLEIVARLVERYDVDEDRLRGDVERLVQSFVDKGLAAPESG